MQDYFSVQGLNSYIEQLFAQDEILNSVQVRGEISGFKYYRQSGHMYFSLKDESAVLSCVMFKSHAARLNFLPEDGMEVMLAGYVAVYSKQGRYQLYVEDIQQSGEGAWFRYLEQIKQELSREGCFDLARKRPLPDLARHIGVVTSVEGAVLRDILRILRQRLPSVRVTVANSAVQGPEAPTELIAGLQKLNQIADLDIIIIGRGGGSMEDLMAFNSPELVRAIVDSNRPVISAVGHEVDISLSDLAADVRAATPTQAAQLAVPDFALLEQQRQQWDRRMWRRMERISHDKGQQLENLLARRVWNDPKRLLQAQQQRRQQLSQRLDQAIGYYLERQEQRLTLKRSSLEQLSPLRVMQRGYAIVMREGRVLSRITDLEPGTEAELRLQDGRVNIRIVGSN